MRISLLLPLVLLAACGPKNVEVTDAGTPAGAGADAATEATPDSGTAPDAGVAENILTLAIGPVPLKAQEERTVCSRFKLPTTAAIDVTKLRTTLAPGSHHLILYISKETTEQKAIYDCQAPGWSASW